MKEERARAIFYPKSIAIVGASSNLDTSGGRYVQRLIAAGFEGKIYPVNPKGGEILGLKAYPDLKSIPGQVDYVIVCVPREFVFSVLDDCTAKGIKVVHFFTAGFRETGEKEGLVVEEQMLAKARQGGFRILGPNCVGVACPVRRTVFGLSPFALNLESGTVAFISHSSGLVSNVIEVGSARGIKFSKLAGLGNCCDLNELDFLEYVGSDPDTTIVGAYFEGTRNGRELFRLLSTFAKVKPIVVLKGGQTEAGAQTAASHTGSVAGAVNLWEVAVKQAGAIFVQNFDELVDTLLAFQYLSPFSGDGVALIGGVFAAGGGPCVTLTDECVSEGFRVPPFRQETRDRLKEILGSVGNILRNPLDMGAPFGENRWEILARTLEIVNDDPGVDVIMVNLWLSWYYHTFSPEEMGKILSSLKDFRENHTKPLIVISRPGESIDRRSADIRTLAEAGIPTYDSVARAAKALAHVREYYKEHA